MREMKWLGRKAAIFNAYVKNAWSCTYSPTYAFMVWGLIKIQEILNWILRCFVPVDN